MPGIKMVVGLGNPGDKYVDTRHNAGFKVIDSVSRALDIKVRRKKFGGLFGDGQLEYCEKLILLKPWEFMNRSGQAVATAVGFYRISLSDLLVISDDMALEPGRIRLRPKGSSGGHNGLGDIVEKLGTEEFGRLRIGIGTSGTMAAEDYVLNKPPESEATVLNEVIKTAREAVIWWTEYGIDSAMNKFNEF